MCVCVCCFFQPGGGCGQDHVHLWSAGAGRGVWSAGGWRSAGSGQKGEAHMDG